MSPPQDWDDWTAEGLESPIHELCCPVQAENVSGHPEVEQYLDRMSTPATSPLSLSDHLQTLTESLAAARTQETVLDVMMTAALAALNAAAGAVLLVDQTKESLTLVAAQGTRDGAQTIWQDSHLGVQQRAGDAVVRREALFFEHTGDLDGASPGLDARTIGSTAVGIAVLPMVLEDRPLGVIILEFNEPHPLTPDEIRFLRTIAAQGALGLGRMHLIRGLEQRVEERTREVEAERTFLRALLGSLGESIIACDADGHLTVFNGVARELHGQDAAPVPPETWAEQYGLYGPDGVTRMPTAQVPLYRAWQGQDVENAVMVVRHPGGEARTLLVNGQPILSEQGERLGAVVAQRDITDWRQQERSLAASRSRAEVLAALGDALQLATSAEDVAERALDRIGAAVGAHSMLVVRLRGEELDLPSVWGTVPDLVTAFLNQPGRSLSDVPTFQQIAQVNEALYLDDYHLQDGGTPPFPAQAVGIEPIRTPDGTLGGFLIAGRPTQAGTWEEGERDLLKRAAGTLGLALERAQATAQLTARSRQLQEEARAQEAFVAFTETIGTETDVVALATHAVDVLQAHFTEGVGGFYEREGELWKLRSWTRNLDAQPDFVVTLRAGLPSNTPFIAQLLRERAPVFTEDWNADHEGIRDSEDYGTVAAYPVMAGQNVRGFFTMGFKHAAHWVERDRAIFRAVGRSLNLALERADQARRLEAQNAELEARTRALEGFAELTRHLGVETDRFTLVRQAQEAVLSLLPPGYALYYERDAGLWRNRVQTGALGLVPEQAAALQAVVDVGFPYDAPQSLVVPWTTGVPYYQDEYVRGGDTDASLVQHVSTVASLPVVVSGEGIGVLAVVLFEAHTWTPTDKAVMETVVRSLGLALERADGVAELEARTQEVSAWRDRYEVAVRGSGHLIYDWDPVTDAILYGGAVEQITGYAPQELDGSLKDWTERLIHPDDREVFQQEIARVIEFGDTFQLSFRVVHKDGSVREVEDDGYFRRNAQVGVARMVGFVKDVTERSRAEEALRQRTVELERSNAELEQFAYIASHDLQAPIRAVTSFAGLIDTRYGPHLDERGRLYLQQIVEGGRHMKRLVDDLLSFSRVHTEQRALAPIDADAVFDVVASRFRTEAPEAQITRGELPRILADGQQFDQLLQNLISNGLKYCQEGITPQVHVWAEHDGAWWRFAVQDNGIGIEPQYFERIFVIFQRLHGRETYEGTGIGLAVCKKIVERHGGRLWVESTPGAGATFFFTLPEAG